MKTLGLQQHSFTICKHTSFRLISIWRGGGGGGYFSCIYIIVPRQKERGPDTLYHHKPSFSHRSFCIRIMYNFLTQFDIVNFCKCLRRWCVGLLWLNIFIISGYINPRQLVYCIIFLVLYWYSSGVQVRLSFYLRQEGNFLGGLGVCGEIFFCRYASEKDPDHMLDTQKNPEFSKIRFLIYFLWLWLSGWHITPKVWVDFHDVFD